MPCFTTFLDIFELMAISSTNSSTPPLFIYSLQPLSGPHTAIAALLLFFHYSIILIVIALLYCQCMLPSFKRAFSTHQPIRILICTFNQFWNTLPASVYPFFFNLCFFSTRYVGIPNEIGCDVDFLSFLQKRISIYQNWLLVDWGNQNTGRSKVL